MVPTAEESKIEAGSSQSMTEASVEPSNISSGPGGRTTLSDTQSLETRTDAKSSAGEGSHSMMAAQVLISSSSTRAPPVDSLPSRCDCRCVLPAHRWRIQYSRLRPSRLPACILGRPDLVHMTSRSSISSCSCDDLFCRRRSFVSLNLCFSHSNSRCRLAYTPAMAS